MKALQFIAGAAVFVSIGFAISYSVVTLLTEVGIRLS